VQWAEKRPNTAYLYAVLGNLTLALGQIFFKTLTAYLNPFQIIYIRSFFVALINFYLLRRENKYPCISSPECPAAVI
jgi:drug/metabolite transporter (DMT)-like permease